MIRLSVEKSGQTTRRVGGFIRRARVGVLVVAAATVVGSAGLGALPAGADSPGSGSWGIWYGLGGPIISDPAPVVTTGQIDVFGVNPNDQQLYEASNAGGSWSGWGKVGVSGTYSLSSKVTAVLDASGNIHVFGTGTGTASNTAYELVYTPGSGWGTWQNRGGPVVGAPSAVLTGGQLDLFATFTDNTVHETSNSGNGWSKWGPVTPSSGSGSLSSSPSAVVDASGGIDIFGLGTGPGTNTVYELSYTAASGWGSWQSVSPAGKLLDTPTAVLSFGHLDLFGVGTNNTLYETSPSGSSWSPWAAVPAQNSGSLGTGAEAVTESNGNIDVFGTGTNAAANNVYTLTYTAPPPPPGPSTCNSTPGNGTAVTRWDPVASCVLAMLEGTGNVTTDQISDVVNIVISHESSGNPDVCNGPYCGLVQVSMSNFDIYGSPSLSNQWLDGAANIYASMHYAIDRYGSIAQIPGVMAVNNGKPYVGY